MTVGGAFLYVCENLWKRSRRVKDFEQLCVYITRSFITRFLLWTPGMGKLFSGKIKKQQQ